MKHIFHGKHSSAKHSSAELMATSSISAIYTDLSLHRPPPPSMLSLLGLGHHSLGIKEAFQMETLFLWRQEGGFFPPIFFERGISVGKLSGVVAKAHLCVWDNGAQTLTASSSHIDQCS